MNARFLGIGVGIAVVLIVGILVSQKSNRVPTPKVSVDFTPPKIDGEALMPGAERKASREKEALTAEIERLKREAEQAKQEHAIALEQQRSEAEKARRSQEEATAERERDKVLVLQQQKEREKAAKAQAEQLKQQAVSDAEEKERAAARQDYERYRADLKEGEALVTIVVRNRLSTPIPNTAKFTMAGTSFSTYNGMVGVTNRDAVVSDQERPLVPRGDGTFEFTITVRSKSPGVPFTLAKDTVPVMDYQPALFVKAYVPDNFEGWKKGGTPAGQAAAQQASNAKIEELLNLAIPKYYECLITDYPTRAARNAARIVGGGKTLEDALIARFQIKLSSHQPPDTKLDRELGSKAKESFEKLLSVAKAKYLEALPTGSHRSAVQTAADNSERLSDALMQLKSPELVMKGRTPTDLQVRSTK